MSPRQDDGPREGFAARWSRRKRAAAETEPKPGPDLEPDLEPKPQPDPESAETAPPETDDALLARLGLPHPESVDDPDMIRTVLRADLPRHLRQIALRRLWRLNPMLANLDGLVDYGEDFTDSAMGAGVVATAYQVGRGFLRDPDPDPDTTQGPDSDPDSDPGPDSGPDLAPDLEPARTQEDAPEASEEAVAKSPDPDASTLRDDVPQSTAAAARPAENPNEIRMKPRKRVQFSFDAHGPASAAET